MGSPRVAATSAVAQGGIILAPVRGVNEGRTIRAAPCYGLVLRAEERNSFSWAVIIFVIVERPLLTAATEVAIIDFCRGKLGGFERPGSVEFVEALSRNPTGKVLKRALRGSYWAGHQRRVAGA
ncbi:MAG: hypothetical protein ACE5JN_07465 [Candidatus Methylomirabilia bacterium]